MRKALIVGIDYYNHVGGLHGCVNDAYSVKTVLERNSDGTVNFGAKLLTGTGPTDLVTRASLRESIKELFSGECETALFYFAGHGHIESTGGYIIPSDASSGDEGLPLGDVLTFANSSKARNRIIVLDSCHSGIAGTSATAAAFAEIKEGTTILTASTAEQYATEENGSGVFTSLLVDALGGAAANLVGDVTPGSIYAHVDQSLGPWDQRPVFKTNIKSFVSLRRVQAAIALGELQRITEFFPQSGETFPLDPTFEPERQGVDPTVPPPDPVNTAKFAILQKYNRVGLVVPVDAPHMWHAAMGYKGCRLTVLGEHYRRLVERGRI
ncbi:peptidase (caspase-1 like protein) [Paraburkholderia hospita]|uniref:Peptidase (Caspase-1 like protein) n=1 Tax=Paraburkholderia hospita TaxID=169430 RepID=A0ABN0FD29_9BURK|nr:caspase family protein [Paraburkholderia hospita]EIM96563.1 peptidase (caspase-1 like protein) [Paraburkholderia hospita]OUL79627.1 peptidase C14 [Paraburkholderia hospita]